jgi:hypothetical protein
MLLDEHQATAHALIELLRRGRAGKGGRASSQARKDDDPRKGSAPHEDIVTYAPARCRLERALGRRRCRLCAQCYGSEMRFTSLALAAVASVSCISSVASGDPEAASVSVTKIPVIVVYGRPNRPNVQIVIKTPTAADAAGAAHDTLHAALLAQTEPGALRATP